MTLIASMKKGSAVVVRFQLPGKTFRTRRNAHVFLSKDRQFKFRASMTFKDADFHVEFVSAVVSHIKSSVFKFILLDTGTSYIQEIETFLERPGRIVYLIGQAQKAPNKKAHENDLLVSIEDLDDSDDFSAFPPEQEPTKVSGMKFYEYTETAHALLNDVVTGYTRLAFKEKKKELPDADFLAELEANKVLALNLLRQSKTFASLDQMSEVIAEYTPIVRALYDHTSPSSLAVS